MKTKNNKEVECTVYETVDFIGKKWTLLILLDLYKENIRTKRYSELKRALKNITPKILSSRLKELEAEKMLKKEIDVESVPVKCFYSLTKKGIDFIEIIKKIKKWSIKWNYNNEVCEVSDCKKCELSK